MNEIEVKTPEYVSLQFEPAGLGSRSVAFIIDQAILTVATIILVVIFMIILPVLEAGGVPAAFADILLILFFVLLFLINWGYFVVYEFFSAGRTVGKMAIGIRVIQENGHSITLLSSFLRNLLRIIDALPTSYLLGILMIFLHPKHKRIGDLVAGTIVVHEKRKKAIKRTSIDVEIEKRKIQSSDQPIVLSSFGKKEWDLLKMYSERLLHLQHEERIQVTEQLAAKLFPKAGIPVEGKTHFERENGLLLLYVKMKEEWEFEL
ncbi:RDD family protein [Alkalihalobacterium bogoriense]|uniref:RDD family protein n=1 Tax=Alkalihalobacterium bogoriense TaxID=246272 RepID=UPI000478C68D|nr:RDD family protein [Alkalihalobacterium bogoriense]